MAKKKVTVTEQADGTVKFEGGTIAEGIDATIAWMVKRHGVEGLKDMILGEAAKGLTLPAGNFCGTARATRILMGEEG